MSAELLKKFEDSGQDLSGFSAEEINIIQDYARRIDGVVTRTADIFFKEKRERENINILRTQLIEKSANADSFEMVFYTNSLCYKGKPDWFDIFTIVSNISKFCAENGFLVSWDNSKIFAAQSQNFDNDLQWFWKATFTKR